MSKYVIWLHKDNGVVASSFRDDIFEEEEYKLEHSDYCQRIIDVAEPVEEAEKNIDVRMVTGFLVFLKNQIEAGEIKVENLDLNTESRVKYFELCFTEKEAN